MGVEIADLHAETDPGAAPVYLDDFSGAAAFMDHPLSDLEKWGSLLGRKSGVMTLDVCLDQGRMGEGRLRVLDVGIRGVVQENDRPIGGELLQSVHQGAELVLQYP